MIERANPPEAVSPEALGAIIEHAADALIYADRDGVIRVWNAAASRLFGFGADEALGQSLDLIIPDKLREAHWRGFDQAMATGRMRLGGEPTVTRGTHKSGARLYVEMTFALVRDARGEAIGSVAIARNVTARVEREKAARSSAP
ncbi:MAG TPA: PAS domain S-box protein [Casimicrobiaceae bacterium]|nr:PAS domain S-box protein [Casimicrobiaceae bacterium]